MLGSFSEKSQQILLKAREEMQELNHPYIGTEHLILSILKNEETISKKLENYGLTYSNFKKEILTMIGKGTKKPPFFLHTPLLKKVIENACLDAKDNNNGEVTPEHLLSSLIEVGEGIAIRILISMNINIEDIYDEFSTKLIKKIKKKHKKLLIEELGINLIEKAQNNQLDPVVGRGKEINRLIEILCRRTKNNPLLIGEAGVGKTAIVEQLALDISKGKVPNILKNKKIFSLDMSTLIAGTKYRGEFEERLQKMLKEIIEDTNIIIFIDEIHTLVGAGGAEGAIDASNILKPALARGTLRCIGATTTKEYKKYIEEDKALERRFQKITIEEPNIKETINILTKLKPIYEQFHHIIIPKELLKEIVELSNQYIYNRHNPDKAIDILDETSSMVSIKQTKEENQYNDLKEKLSQIQSKKNDLILDNNIKSAYTYLKQESNITTKLNSLELSLKASKKTMTKEDIAKVIHEKTNLPVYEIMKDNLTKVKKLETELSKTIIGQEEAIKTLIDITKRIRLGYSNHKIKSYLFVGPTGVGKTKLAKEYARHIVGAQNIIKLDMSEYSDSTGINKILGSSPGYIGYQDKNNIIEKIKEKPNAIIILDEIDKAHSKVINLLYQILEEGKITNSENETIYLSHNIIIMTTNIGFEETKLGFQKEQNKEILSSLKEKFPTPLLNRIDKIIIFKTLDEKNIKKIVKTKLENLNIKYKNLTYTNTLIKEIIIQSNYKEYGARKIEKIIEDQLENIIIDKLINKEELKIDTLKELSTNR